MMAPEPHVNMALAAAPPLQRHGRRSPRLHVIFNMETSLNIPLETKKNYKTRMIIITVN